MKLYVLIGNIGSGKTTWAKEKVKESEKTIIISRDALREMIKSKYTFDQVTEPMILEWRTSLLGIAFQYEFDVILDETSLSRMHRNYLLKTIELLPQRNNITVVYVLFTENKRNVEFRMKENSRGYSQEYWEEVYQRMGSRFNYPDLDEYDEMIKIKIP